MVESELPEVTPSVRAVLDLKISRGKVRVPTQDEQRQCLALYRKLFGRLRNVAGQLGYALLSHGSNRRDIDLVAIPWTGPAADPQDLAEAIRVEAETITGRCFWAPEESVAYFRMGCPGLKDHGRLVFALHLLGSWGPYIDLSVMPPAESCISGCKLRKLNPGSDKCMGCFRPLPIAVPDVL